MKKRKKYFAKRGYFFSIIALLLVLLLFFALEVTKKKGYEEKSLLREKRAIKMNDFIKAIETDMSAALYISSVRAILTLDQEFIKRGDYVPSLDANFQELVLNGTMDGTSYNLTNNSNLLLWAEKIEYISQKFNINMTFVDFKVNIYQDSPWFVNVNVTSRFIVQDNVNKIFWNTSYTAFTKIDIQMLDDPLYTLGSSGTYTQKIRKSPFTQFVVGGNVDNLLNHTLESYYIAYDGSPSFLKRLQGDYSNSTQGIESLVNIEKLSDTFRKTKTAVDWIYFDDSKNPQTYNITGGVMPDWFKLDNESNHLTVYQVENIAVKS